MKASFPLLFSLLSTTMLTPIPVCADVLPVGGTVASGAAVITQPSASQLNISQSTNSAIINWQSFSVGQGNSVNIIQPSSSATLLNRVTGSTPSTIAGQINANGRVFLVNPNGIVITSTGQVNAAGFVASTLDITDDNFKAGKYLFNGNGASAAVINRGEITIAEGGYAALIGGTVSNEGNLYVPLGKVALASGEQVTLDPTGDGFLQVAVPTAAGGSAALVSNSGKISAKGGAVIMSAATATDLARQAVNMSGVIEAKSVSGRKGSITLSGGDSGSVAVAGTLDVSSVDATGGSVTVTGKAITLTKAKINASGAKGGGTVKIGGDAQGKGTLHRATTVTLDADTVIKADATQNGDGGSIVLWANDTLTARGTLSAKGGSEGGNGGLIETSAKQTVDFTGLAVDTSATLGSYGNWLIDPTNLTVDAAAASTISTNLASTGVTLQTNSDGSTSGTGTTSSGSGDIIINSAISWTAATTLTLNAYNAIAVNAPITVGGNGAVSLTYATASATNLLFSGTGKIVFSGAGTYASQALTINSTTYKLIYTMANLDAIDALSGVTGSAVTVYGAGKSGKFALASNLDASGTTYTRPLVTGTFTGVLEGLGNTITSLTISTGTTQSSIGLFNDVGAAAAVRDLNLTTASVTFGYTGSYYAGILVGMGEGLLANIFTSGTITLSDTLSGYSPGGYMGGIAGAILSTAAAQLVNSHSSANVYAVYNTGSDTVNVTMGGLAGLVSGSGVISNSYATGVVSATVNGNNANMGGLVGIAAGSVINSYATGAVTYTGSATNIKLGGLIGDLSGSTSVVNSVHSSGAVTYAATGTATVSAMLGGLIGNASTDVTQNLYDMYATGAVLAQYSGGTANVTMYIGGLFGFFGGSGATLTNAYATGNVTDYLTGTMSYNHSVGGLIGSSTRPIQGTANSLVYATGAVLYQGKSTYVYIGGLAGQITASTAYASSAGSVTFSTTNTSSVTAYVGGFVGYNDPSTAGISASTSSSTVLAQYGSGGTAGGTGYIGGFVGYNNATIDPSITTSYATGSVTDTLTSGTQYVGGFVGYGRAASKITNAYSTGNVSKTGTTGYAGGFIGYGNSTSTVKYAYSTGTVTAGGGTVDAFGSSAVLTSAYWDTTTSGRATSTSTATGYTTAQLQSNYNSYMTDLGSAFIGGYGSYPTLSAFYGGGAVQIFGVVYADGGVTTVGSGATVYLTIGGLVYSTATTNSSGFYYFALSNDTITAGGGGAAVYTVTNAGTGTTDAVSFAAGASGTLSNFNLYGGWRYDNSGTSITNLSTVNSQYTTSIGTTAASGLSFNNRSITIGSSSFVLDAATTLSGTLVISAAGTVTQSAAITASKLLLLGGGTFTLNSANAISTLAANVAALQFKDTLNLTIGTATSASNLTTTGINTSGDTTVVTTGSLTIGTGAAASGANVVLATDSAFVNNAGSSAVTATSGRWLVYSANAAGDTFGGLNSNNTAVWSATYSTLAPASVTATGNRYLFNMQPTATVTLTNATKTYGDDGATALSTAYSILGLDAGVSGAYAADSGSLDLTGALSLSSTGSAATAGVGGYAINGTVLGATASGYLISLTGSGTLTVSARPITVTATAFSRTYGDANGTLAYTIGGSGLANSDTLSGALATTATTASNVGSYGITQGTLAASSNYSLTYVGGNLTVTARPITITADAASRAYGDANPTLTYTIGGSGLVNSDTLSGALTTTATTTSNVGTYGITQGTLAASGNYSLTYVGDNLTVTARPITITADALSRAYGDANPTLTYTVGGSGLVNSDSLSGALATTATTTSNVGTYGITQGTLAASGNYSITFTSGNLTVTARPITIVAVDKSKVFGVALPTLTYTLGGGGLVNGDTLSGALATTANSSSAVGTYAITQGTVAASSNYSISFTSGTLTVLSQAITVTADNVSRLYGNANPTFTYTITSGALGDGDSLSGALSTTATVTSGVGTYGITRGTLDNANYVITFVGGTLTVTARPITITADSLSRLYGATNPTLTYTVGGSGLVNSDTLSGALATTATTTSNVGTYGITQGSLAASSNYSVTYTGNNLSVTARPITITADAASRTYGNANPPLTYTVGGSGLVNSDTLSGALATTATTTSNIGSYGITQGSLTNANYAITYTGANLSVTARPIAITATNQNRIYGNANPTLTYTVGGSGLVNSDSLSGALATTATITSNIGTYGITQGTLAASSNYSVTYTSGNLTITARPITITADVVNRTYGNANPSLTYTIGGGGLVNSDSLSGTLATTATTTSNVGTYGITQGSLAATGNYSLTYVAGNLTITARPLTITAEDKTHAYGDANPTLTYLLGGSGLANGDAVSGALTTAASETSYVGSYAISRGSLTAGANYIITFVAGRMVVTLDANGLGAAPAVAQTQTPTVTVPQVAEYGKSANEVIYVSSNPSTSVSSSSGLSTSGLVSFEITSQNIASVTLAHTDSARTGPVIWDDDRSSLRGGKQDVGYKVYP